MSKKTSCAESAGQVCLYPYSTAGLVRGWSNVTGMEAVLAREIHMRRGRSDLTQSTIISSGSPGEQALTLEDAAVTLAPVTTALDPEVQQALLAAWFNDLWSVIHPEAFTSPALPPELAEVVYPEPSPSPVGSFARVLEHIERRMAGRACNPECAFADRFEQALGAIEPGTTVGWTEVFFTESILRHAARLRRQGSKQSLHCFLAHPANLHESAPGRRLLSAMSEVDRVFVQTDLYARRIAAQLDTLRLPCPEIRRFDLAPDSAALCHAVESAPSAPAVMSQLEADQRNLLEDAWLTRERIPHRFVCPDRLDPIKGLHVVIEAVDRFLESQAQPLEVLREKYRFYFVASYYLRYPPVNSGLAWHRYADWVRQVQIPKLLERWPGIVWFCDNIPDRQLWAQLLVDAHVISGGIQEGLGLAVQEGLVINAHTGHARTVVMGDGAGFPIQVREEGLGAHAHFPSAGSAESFRQALATVTTAAATARHLEDSRTLVKRFIEPHQDRLLAAFE